MLDAGTQPPLAHELRQILAIRDQVPGAASILKPIAIRALLRDKEAARRYQPAIEEFFASHREEIDAVLAGMEMQAEPGGIPALESPDGLPEPLEDVTRRSGSPH